MEHLYRFWLVVICCWSAQISAHEVRPAYLQIEQVGKETYRVLWKVPAKADKRLSIDYTLPTLCWDEKAVSFRLMEGAFVTERDVQCSASLAGQPLTFTGLSASLTDILVRFSHDNQTSTFRVTGDTPTLVLPLQPNTTDILTTYTQLGIEHIVLGFDHLLFVFCLLLISGFNRAIIGVITAFTVAHSVTLVASAMQWVYLAVAPVEACIALSIVYTAARAIELNNQADSSKHLWVSAFCFGLLHGFGFAAALDDIGLPSTALGPALLCFNLGVELGQLVFVALCFIVHRFVVSHLKHLTMIRKMSAYAAGGIASYWVIQRVILIAI
ncbi:HupE/UreJ family protein [Alteromonas sp. D210916BOD_24]|uniref:HupE/UreJ family protein n=1 Tax=Alteromonas sp. D210916BOD_24 TaxID=3157618 RepID=UPI00399CECC8